MNLTRRGLLTSLPLFADWPAFRGRDAIGGAAGNSKILTTWNADPAVGKLTGIRWKAAVPNKNSLVAVGA